VKKRRFVRRVFGFVALASLLLMALLIVQGWRAFGHYATEPRLTRMRVSPQWGGSQFVNPQPLDNHFVTMMKGALHISPDVSPKEPVPVAPVDPRIFETAPPSGLRVTWLGHSTTLVEIDGYRVLTDPVWSERVSPIPWLGPRRWFVEPIALSALPKIDAVVISHDHYDHLDHATISAMRGWNTVFVVPLGVGAHLSYWGVPESQIAELDWWEHADIGKLTITCTPARHASGRIALDYDAKLWAGYAFVGPSHRVYFSGDTGLFPAMRDIGVRLGPFDLTMIEVGQYHSAWPDWHIGPEQAVAAHQMVKGRVMLPIHWGKFALAYHAWTEPIERALVAGKNAGAALVAPKPGQSFEPSSPPPIERWWPSLGWKTSAEEPIVSTKMN
jgi:L-ascorbate metabolism protein UlaG (beta-lactamase superfamily)